MSATWSKTDVRRLAGQVAFGFLFGMAATAFVLGLGRAYLPMSNPAAMFASLTGLIYLLMGLLVGVGAAAPKAGARFLNVEDADELNEQRSMLIYGGAACILFGLFFLLLALSAEGPARELLTKEVAAIAAVTCAIVGVWTGIKSTARSDELMRQVSLEGSVLALHMLTGIFAGWAVLAHVGIAAWAGPLVFVSSAALIELVAVFWVGARKGMLKPR